MIKNWNGAGGYLLHNLTPLVLFLFVKRPHAQYHLRSKSSRFRTDPEGRASKYQKNKRDGLPGRRNRMDKELENRFLAGFPNSASSWEGLMKAGASEVEGYESSWRLTCWRLAVNEKERILAASCSVRRSPLEPSATSAYERVGLGFQREEPYRFWDERGLSS